MAKVQVLPEPFIVTSKAEAKAMLRRIKEQPYVALDTETTSLNAHEAHLLVLTVGWLDDKDEKEGGARYYIPYVGQTELFHEVLKPWLEDPNFRKNFQNAKYDMQVLANHGMRLNGLFYDTWVLDWLVDENRLGRHGLKICSLDHLDLRMEELKDLFERHNAETFDQIPEAVKIEYSTKDAWVVSALIDRPSKIWNKPLPQVVKEHSAATPGHPNRTLLDHYFEVEVPFIHTLQSMEKRGITVDRGHLKDLDPVIEKKIDKLEFEFAKKAHRPVLISSPRDLAKLFYDEMGMKVTRWTKGGKSGNRSPSVDKDVIEVEAKREEREGERGLFSTLAEHRKLSKLHSTYVKGLLKFSENTERRIHASFRMDLVTGRLSCSQPNLQNIPKAKSDKWGLRASFIARPTHKGEEWSLIVADYSQIEVRIAAHLSEDTALIDAILSGVDIHSKTAAEMYGLDYDEIMAAKAKKPSELTPDDKKLLGFRDDAKTISFGLYYGQEAYGLSQGLGCTPEEAKDKIERYFAAYPGVRRFIETMHDQCLENLYVQTILGRYRRLPDIRKGMIKEEDGWRTDDTSRAISNLRRLARNQSVNSPIQGSAADIVKVAMIKTSEVPGLGDSELQKLQCHLMLQVHDELIWECPTKNVDRCVKIIKGILEHPFDFELKVPIPADIGVGPTWADAKA